MYIFGKSILFGTISFTMLCSSAFGMGIQLKAINPANISVRCSYQITQYHSSGAHTYQEYFSNADTINECKERLYQDLDFYHWYKSNFTDPRPGSIVGDAVVKMQTVPATKVTCRIRVDSFVSDTRFKTWASCPD